MTEEILPADVMSAEALDDTADIYLFADGRAVVVGAVPRRRRELSMGGIHTWCREYDLFHADLMKPGDDVHHDWIAELESAPERGDNEGPVLCLPYLPLMLDRFRAAGPPGGRCHVRGPADSVRRPLTEWHGTGTPTLTAAFAAQGARTPDPTAPVFEDADLSYAELNARPGSPRTAP